MRISAFRRTSTTPTTSRPIRKPIPTAIIRSGPSTSITVWVPTPIRRLTGPDSTRMFPGDIPEFRGLFKAPSMRGTDKRPSPDFVKAYMHNGVFKSLKDVVHFYNKRNIAVDASGKETAFDLRKGPPAGYAALFPAPEVLENVQNVAGVTPAQATTATESNGQVGNLQLSSQQEDDLINFLKILNDGYTKPNPVSP